MFFFLIIIIFHTAALSLRFSTSPRRPRSIVEGRYEAKLRPSRRHVVTLCIGLGNTGDLSIVPIPRKYKTTMVLQILILFTRNGMIIEYSQD